MDLRKKIAQKGPQLSRIDRWRRNPVPWIVALVFIFSIGAYYILPNGDAWLTKTGEISEFEEQESELKTKQQDLKFQLEEITNKYNELSSETRKKENQIFPKEFSISKVVKILELYSLLLGYDIDETNYFKLASINFAEPIKGESKYSTIKANIKIIGARSNIHNFVTFLQTGKIPNDVSKKMLGVSDYAIDLRFLSQNLLPIAVLNSIRITEFKSTETTVSDLFSVEIQVNFYAQ